MAYLNSRDKRRKHPDGCDLCYYDKYGKRVLCYKHKEMVDKLNRKRAKERFEREFR